MKSKTIFIYVAVGVVGLISIWFYKDSWRRGSNVTPSPSETITPSFTTIPSPSKSVKPIYSASPAISGKTPSCNIAGEIVFIDLARGMYETRGAEFAWQNIDDSSRLIFWDYAPNDGSLSFGPRIFASLPLPSGSYIPGVSIAKDVVPSAKSYLVTSKITYGVTDSRGVETIKNMPCTGSIKLTFP